MISTIFKKSFKVALYLIVLIAILVTSIYIWLGTGPRSLSFMNNYITSQVNHFIPNFELKIQTLEAGLDLSNLNSYLLVKDAEITSCKDERQHFLAKRTVIYFNILSLLPFSNKSFVTVDFSLDDVNFDALQDHSQDKKFSLPIQQINGFFIENQATLKRINFVLENTSFKVKLENHPILVKIEKASIAPIKRGKLFVFEINGIGEVNQEPFNIRSVIQAKTLEKLEISSEMKDISYKLLSDLGFKTDVLNNADIKLNFNINASVSNKEGIDAMEFKVTSDKGVINPNLNFKEAIHIGEVVLNGKCKYKCSAIEVSELRVKTGKTTLLASGNLADGLLNLKMAVNKMKVGELLRLWPKTLETNTYNWISEHIKDGMLGNISVVVNHSFKSSQEAQDSPSNSQNNMHIWFPIYNATLQNIKNLPNITQIDGVTNIYNNQLDLKVNKAKVLDSSLSDFKVYILDLKSGKSPMTIKGKISGPLQDSLSIAFNQMKTKENNFKNLSGEINSNIEITFPITQQPITNDEINIHMESDVSNLNGEIFNDNTISEGTLKILLQNRKLNIDGKAIFDKDMPIDIQHTQSILNVNKEDYINQTKVKFALSQKDIMKLAGYDVNNIVGGGKISAMMVINQEYEQPYIAKVKLNLKDNSLDFPTLGISKPVGTPAGVILTLSNNQKGGFSINNYQITIPNLYSEGVINIDNDSNITTITSNKTLFDKNLLSFIYKSKPKQNQISIKGNTIDLSKLDFGKVLDNGKSTRKKSLALDAKISHLKLKNNVTVDSASLNLKCDVRKCKSMGFSGSFTKGGIVTANLSYPNLDIESTNAGSMIAAIGVSPNIYEGILKFSGNFTAKEDFAGKLYMQNYHLRHTPLLAQLVTLSSLTTASGILNMLKGQGVFFDALTCPFDYNSGLITLKKCVEKGPVINILAHGTIDLNKDYVDLSGTLIPANIINSIVDNIPLIGSSISGGKDSGIIGTNFTLKGKMDKDGPSVFVNPLSILTPGFLRNIFN